MQIMLLYLCYGSLQLYNYSGEIFFNLGWFSISSVS